MIFGTIGVKGGILDVRRTNILKDVEEMLWSECVLPSFE
jgi:hypothetical protein